MRAAIVQLRAGESGRRLARSILDRVSPHGSNRPISLNSLPSWGLAHRLAADAQENSSDEVPEHDNDSSNDSINE